MGPVAGEEEGRALRESERPDGGISALEDPLGTMEGEKLAKAL